MTVKELIESLSECDPDLHVAFALYSDNGAKDYRLIDQVWEQDNNPSKRLFGQSGVRLVLLG